ncbi:hypothetical protein LTR95_002473 [Oleoguttula sp. CCFEE 5521]
MPSASLIIQVFEAIKGLPTAPWICLDLTASRLEQTTVHRDVYLALATISIPLEKLAVNLASLYGLEDFVDSDFETGVLACCGSLDELNVDFQHELAEKHESKKSMAAPALPCRMIVAAHNLQILKIRMDLFEGLISLEHTRQVVRCLLVLEPGPGLRLMELSGISLKLETLFKAFDHSNSTVRTLVLEDIDLTSAEGVGWTTMLPSVSMLPHLKGLSAARLYDTDARINKGWMFAGTEERKE